MSGLPAHASPALAASDDHIQGDYLTVHPWEESHHHHEAPPPNLLSPQITPPSTPGTGTPALERDAPSIPLDTSATSNSPQLLHALPDVTCVVRARIPTTTGQEMFLHLYQNNVDDKEHLAIVFGPQIRSKSLDAPRSGETEQDRMIRGAYTGRLYPGRTSSGFVPSSTTASPLQKSLYKPVANLGHSEGRSHAALDRRTINASSEVNGSINGKTTSGTTKKAASHQAPLVRIHSECYTGETVWSARCDCGEQLDEAARLMSLPSAQESGGVIVYLRQEGRGIGLSEKLKAYNLQDLGNDTVEANLLLRHPADARSYGLATAILVDLGLGGRETEQKDETGVATATESTVYNDSVGVTGIRLLTNNPDKVRAVEGPNREVIVRERVPMIPIAWRSGGASGIHSPEVGGYLRTKIEKMGHMLQMG